MATRAQHLTASLQKYPPTYRAAIHALQAQGFARRRSQIRKYFAADRDFAGLQIGAGRHHLGGWLTTDLVPREFHTVYLDASKRFPFRDETFDYIVAEHIIEHLTYGDAIKMLKECHRVLVGAGILRVSTPDIHLLCQLMSPPLTGVLERYVSWSNRRFDGGCEPHSVAHVVNRLEHDWGHQFLYDQDTLIAALEQCGFAEATRSVPNESEHPALANVDGHAKEVGEEFNQLESLIVEATK
jgi:predicted SAM-dependent methyltransferase